MKTIMNPTLTLIRTRIAELEAKIINLRIAEQELLELGSTPLQKETASATPKAERASKVTTPSPAPQTIGSAITNVLNTRGALSVAEIAEKIKANGREIDRRKISFSLQALKKQGLVKMEDGNWVLAKLQARRGSKTRPKRNLTAAEATQTSGASQTVGEHISSILTESGPLSLSELAKNIKVAGTKVKNSTLSNTLRKLKLRGVVKITDGKWELAKAS